MKKRYQIFISSTYLDLIPERQKVIETILGFDQFPAGMELFEASDKDQWEIITDTIDNSDYYVLIIKWKYGSVFKDGPDKGISYTEKEFDYAVSKGIPVLAFIISDEVACTGDQRESDPEKAAALLRFIAKVEDGRTVKFWHNADELANMLSRSLFKGIARGNRPGWVRSTDFDVEKSHAEIIRLTERVHKLEELNADLKFAQNRKPRIWIEPILDMSTDGTVHNENCQISRGEIHIHVLPVDMRDAEKGITYKDAVGKTVYAHREEVRMFRYICKNAIPLKFRVRNDGNAPATGVRIQILYPNELLTMSAREIIDYLTPGDIPFSEESYENWNLRFFGPMQAENNTNPDEKDEKVTEIYECENSRFVSLDELAMVSDIANLLDPAYSNEGVSIYPGEIRFKDQELGHKGRHSINGVFMLPTDPGEFNIKCRIICNEYADIEIQTIKVFVE